MSKYLAGGCILLAMALLALGNLYDEARKEKTRLAANQEALMADVTFYKTSAGDNAAKVKRIELTKNEFEKQCAELTQEVERLGIKTKRLQSVISTNTKTEATIKTVVRDSIVFRDRERPPDTLRCFDYADLYLTLNGCINKDTAIVNYQNVDSLIHVVHRVPKKFLFFKWGCKAIEMEVVSKNPNTKLTYSRFIEFKK